MEMVGQLSLSICCLDACCADASGSIPSRGVDAMEESAYWLASTSVFGLGQLR